jgi:hypothetical protein
MKRRSRGALALLVLFMTACGGDEDFQRAGDAAAPDLPSVQAPEGAPSTQAQPVGAAEAKAIQVTGSGPVIQILPGPFPFPDSAAPVIAQRPDDQRAKLEKQVQEGPYSNNVALISGNFSFTAWDRGATGDSVAGTAEFKTQDGANWRVMLKGVQTVDIPHNPRFGGVIIPLVYHGSTGNHTPLVPTSKSAVALWTYAELFRNGQPVGDSVPAHVMMISRTRRKDFRLECYNCVQNPIEELQLQIAPAEGKPRLETPGGVLFVNWQKSTYREIEPS